jgi:hypothetical protein
MWGKWITDMVRQVQADNQDRQRRRAARLLDVAHCMHHNGTFAALAWAAAGRPAGGISPETLRAFQQARDIIHGNGGKLRPGDVGRLIERIGRGQR